MPQTLLARQVTVVGSLNIDRLWQVARLPRPGETVFAGETRQEFGGKGANQAVAAARNGLVVAMIGAVGADADGRLYCEHLQRERVDTGGVAIHPVVPRDTVGAGDTFAGTLAAQLAEGAGWANAIQAANVAAALSTLGTGAQTPIPPRSEVEAVLCA